MLGRIVDEAAARFGDATALVSPDGMAVSFDELATASDEVAAGLAEQGIGEGDVVALLLGADPAYVIAYLGAAKAGAITAGVNTRLTTSEQAAVLAAASPRLVLATARRSVPALDPSVALVAVEPTDRPDGVLGELRVRGGTPPVVDDDPERPVAIVFTSGTTGLPKGAVFGGRQLEAITRIDTGLVWAAEPGAPQIAGTSLTHLGPMTKLAGTLVRGARQHLLERWRAGEALELVARERVSVIGGIPTQVSLMLRHPDLDRHDLSCVQAVVMGGGPATPALIRAARDRFGAPVAVRYSCTEAGIGVGTSLTDPPTDAEVSVGRPHPGVELTVRDDDGTVLARGEEGEICLCSPAQMTGYWRDEAATASAFTADGAVRTGDAGLIDESGRLRLVGRRSDRFVRGGYNVAPTEVEGVLADHPAVAAVAVVARPDEVMGEVGVAVVVAAPGATPTLDALRAFGAERLAHHKLPEDLVVIEALPLTGMDKLDRRALADLVTTRPAAT